MIIKTKNYNYLESKHVWYDGVHYEFETTSFHTNSLFGQVLIIDHTHNERYICDGRIELNGHVFMVTYGKEYYDDKYVWKAGKDIHIYIDEEHLINDYNENTFLSNLIERMDRS